MEIARRIRAVAFDNPSARVVADKIAACGQAENVWTGEDLHNDDGECYSATGTLWRCYERLCPNCLVAHSRRSRKRLRTALEKLTPGKGERVWLVTLTMPTLPAAKSPLLLTLSVVQRAWRLFSQRTWWRQVVRGGGKGVEFTLGDETRRQKEKRQWAPAIDGYHVHVHLLILSRWLNWQTLREEWTECLQRSWREAGISNGIKTRDGLAVCNVKPVTKENFDGVLCEVAKYITKSESWLSIPKNQLAEVASVERWPRMFELLGECRGEFAKSRSIARIGKHTDADVSILDRIEALRTDGDQSDFSLARQAEAELYVLLELQPETRAAIETRTRYLDTPHVFAATHTRDGPLRTRQRARSLREVGVEMVSAGRIGEWRAFLKGRVSKVQDFRRTQQVGRYPFAKFTSLDGHTWSLRRSAAVGGTVDTCRQSEAALAAWLAQIVER